MVLLAFDDTDSVSGGCTTFALYEFLRGLEGVDLIGWPRLVRLNPNIPHKTRGNGAVAVELGHGSGPPRVAGEIEGEPLWCYPQGQDLRPDESLRIVDAARRAIEANARFEDEKTHPGLVVSHSRPDPAFYWSAVRRYVSIHEADERIRLSGAQAFGWKKRRGVLGALAATSWPGEHGTFEWIAYRARGRIGSRRRIDAAVGPTLDAEFPGTFDNHDPTRGVLRITPHAACPVLFGIRGVDADELVRAHARVGPEESPGGLLFATNQATDDHFVARSTAELRPYMSATIEGEVVRAAVSMPGGHVFLRVRDPNGSIEAAAFEPTGEFRSEVRSLRAGQRVRVYGGVHEDPSLLSLERIETLDSRPVIEARAPWCGRCGRRMKSRGRSAPFRCDRCHRWAHGEPVIVKPVPAAAFEVPVRVRRHLTRPLSLRRLATNLVSGNGKVNTNVPVPLVR